MRGVHPREEPERRRADSKFTGGTAVILNDDPGARVWRKVPLAWFLSRLPLPTDHGLGRKPRHSQDQRVWGSAIPHTSFGRLR